MIKAEVLTGGDPSSTEADICLAAPRDLNLMREGTCPALESIMTLDEYNGSVRQILAEQQEIAQLTAQLAMSGQASPGDPQFAQIMIKQWAVVQKMAKLNTDLMLGIMAPKK